MLTFSGAFDALKGLTNYETMVRPPYGTREMNLPRTRRLLRDLGSPDRAYPSLQVAGTKGKGTAAHALAAILRAGGNRVGLYTSPHLFDVRERIAVDGAWIPKGRFAALVAEILPFVEPHRGTPRCPTFFELMTCLALLHFARSEVDVAVLEVGLGGRLDATSAVRPIASLITHIGLDHTAILGKTTTRIAAEKAGVAKRGVPLVSGVRDTSSPGAVIARIAEESGAPVFVAGTHFAVRTGRPAFAGGRASTPVWMRGPDGVNRQLSVGLLGRELARDAALAAATLLVPSVRRRFPVPPEAMAAALAALRLPGRIQVVRERPFVVVDGAHNPDSAASLVRTLREALRFDRVHAVLGGGIDKDVPGTARAVRSLSARARLHFARPASHPRAADPADLARVFPGATAWPSLQAALHSAIEEAKEDDLVLVTGSLYLAGEALRLLHAAPSDR